MYLKQFRFPSHDDEFEFFRTIKRNCYSSFYPFQIFSTHDDFVLDFEPITILYGGNGSGKTTALNVIAECLSLHRDSAFNCSNFFKDYTQLCRFDAQFEIPEKSRIITSDDVFDFALSLRGVNHKIDLKREDLFDEYLDTKFSKFQMKSLDDYDKLKKVNQARSKTQSRFVVDNLMANVRTHSNGENAFRYFTEKIDEKALYLLDEPENSLSPKLQLELVQFLVDSARFYGCQIIIATHSPFVLSIPGAKIYDLNKRPIEVNDWKSLEHMQIYFEFFKKHMP